MPPSLLDLVYMGTEPDYRTVNKGNDINIVPTSEMKAWRDIQATVCSFCGKFQRQKLLCGKVRCGLKYL